MASTAHQGAWRKRSSGCGNCVELRFNIETGKFEVRNSEHPEGTVLSVSPSAMNTFFAAIRDGLLANLAINTDTIVADEIVVRGRADGGFTMAKKDSPDVVEYDRDELLQFEKGVNEGAFDDMVPDNTKVFTVA